MGEGEFRGTSLLLEGLDLGGWRVSVRSSYIGFRESWYGKLACSKGR